MIAIIDYGLGNVIAIRNIFKRLNIECELVSEAANLEKADKLILPGVGAFDEAMNLLNQSGMREAVDDCVLKLKKPVVGICVGMQMMAESSDEGSEKGLGWFSATVKKFDESTIPHKPKIPHMGWNSIAPVKEHRLFTDVDPDKGCYFLHSYYFSCNQEEDVLCTTSYGIEFASVVHKDNIYGIQFHPEKSHSNGINIFKNFAELD